MICLAYSPASAILNYLWVFVLVNTLRESYIQMRCQLFINYCYRKIGYIRTYCAIVAAAADIYYIMHNAVNENAYDSWRGFHGQIILLMNLLRNLTLMAYISNLELSFSRIRQFAHTCIYICIHLTGTRKCKHMCRITHMNM